MNTISGIGSSSDASYAAQLARTSKLGRNLNTLDGAIQKGDMTAAGAMIASIVQQNPQFALSTGASSTSQDPINQGFNDVSAAISTNQPGRAKAAWNQLKITLAQSGIIINDGSENTKKLLADAKREVDKTILNSVSTDFGGMNTLGLPASSGSSANDAVSAVVNSWITYKADATSGTTSVKETSTAPQTTAIPTADTSVNAATVGATASPNVLNLIA